MKQNQTKTSSKYKPGDLVRKINGRTNYLVVDTLGNYISTSTGQNWTHESKFMLVRDGGEFREELRKRIERYIDEQSQTKAQKESGETQGEGGDPAVSNESPANPT